MTGPTKVSRAFLKDFAYIANFYDWDSATIEEVKNETRGKPELMKFWVDLADAHRKGYRQTKENNYMNLWQWMYEHYGKDPIYIENRQKRTCTDTK